MHNLPNLVVGLFFSVVSIDNSIVALPAEPFYAVTPSNGSENLYLTLSRVKALSELSYVREDTICDAILRSPFLSIDHALEMIHPSDVSAYARRFNLVMKEWLMLRRPYEMFNVSVPPNVIRREAVFPCLGKLKGGKNDQLKMFFVSQAYNLYRLIDKKRFYGRCPRVTGHFVFEYRKNEKVARLVAVAEEPADMLGRYFLDPDSSESQERNVRIYPDAMGTRGRDICKFARTRKVHICAVALNAEQFRSFYVTFLPLENRIEPVCEKRGLIYHTTKRHSGENQPDDKMPHDIEFSEWVIGCKTDLFLRGETTTTTYYVSLGEQPYQFYLYQEEAENKNVSVLIHHFYSYLGVDNPDFKV